MASSARDDQGIDQIAGATERHLAWLAGTGRETWEHRRALGRVRTFLDLVAEDARAIATAALGDHEKSLREALESGSQSPYGAAAEWAERRTV